MAESALDPTGVEGIYDEPYHMGPRKTAAMANPQDYTINTLFPLYEGRIKISKSAYVARDGLYYPGIGLAGYTGPRVSDLMDYAKAHGLPWYSLEANMGLFESELSTRYSYLLTDDFKNCNNIEDAVVKFVLCYENPGGIPQSWYANRINYAHDFYDGIQ